MPGNEFPSSVCISAGDYHEINADFFHFQSIRFRTSRHYRRNHRLAHRDPDPADSFLARIVARGYLELIRNTPLLVQIFFLYFVLAPIFGFSRFFAGVLALSLFEGAYISEIFRAGIVSIHKGQWEASHSLGLSIYDTYRCIILPQAIRRILPPLTSQAISLIKDSALVSTIAVYDLTMEGRAVIAETFLTFEIWFTVALMYLIITVTLSIIVNTLENRFRIQT